MSPVAAEQDVHAPSLLSALLKVCAGQSPQVFKDDPAVVSAKEPGGHSHRLLEASTMVKFTAEVGQMQCSMNHDVSLAVVMYPP